MPNPKRNFPYIWLLLLPLIWLAACSDDHPTDVGEPTPGLALFPEDGAILISDFVVSIGTDAVDSMAVFMDDSLLTVVASPPFTLPVMLVNHGPGEHALAVTVFDGAVQDHLAADVLICFGVGRDVGNYAPSFSLEDLEGVTHSFRTSPGAKVLLLDFWAPWCPPCVASLPETQSLFEEYGGKGLDVLTIVDEDEEWVRSFIQENRYSFPVLLDSNSMAHMVYGIWGLPTYYLIDDRGVIRHVILGTGGRPLEEIILELLYE